MSSITDRCWAVVFVGYSRALLALGLIPGIGWKVADAFQACVPAYLRQRGARAYLVTNC